MRNQGNFFSSKNNFIDDQPAKSASNSAGEDADYYATTATADHAIECLKDHANNHGNSPFFQYVAFIAPHFPLHARPGDIAKYKDKYLDGWDQMREARYARQKQIGLVNSPLSKTEPDVGPPYHFPEALEKLGPGEVNRPVPWVDLNQQQREFQATKMAIHAAMVDSMDQEIGRILAQLESTRQLDNTLILFASDNGASAEIMVRNGGHDPQAAPGSAATYLCLGPGFSSACNTPFRRHKTWVHEGGISTPLVVHWPKGIKQKNALRKTPAHVIDIAPTVLELAGVDKPQQWEGVAIPAAPGKSLVRAIQQDINIERESLWWLHEGNRAVRVGDWKLVATNQGPWELYDLAVDRAEQTDLAKKKPEKVSQLEAIWQQQTDAFTMLSKQK
jgi:arylsulfatase